jgi:MerR family transcriptional regulator, light-induced transcriptional regulator
MKYTIRTVSSMTGLSQYTIRAWERRHHILNPSRTESNRRVYSDSDVSRLQLLRQTVEAGHSIGQASQLTNDELRELTAFSMPEEAQVSHQREGDDSQHLLDIGIAALNRLDEDAFRDALARGTTFLGALGFIENLILPLLSHIEHRWMEKSISIAQEHMASAVLRTVLEQLRTSIPAPTNSSRLLVTTPKGQMHELGALITSVIAGLESWNVTYLGPNLPAAEIAGAIRQSGAQAVALSLVYPMDDPDIENELLLLRRLLGDSFPILVGGRAASGYLTAVQGQGLFDCKTFDDFREALAKIPLNG